MAKKKRDERVETASPGELKHNPFAGLLGAGHPSEAIRSEPVAAASMDELVGPVFTSKVVVRRETKGRGGKTVVRITGITSAHRERLAAECKRRLGCGAVVEGEDVVVLGDLADRAVSLLEDEGARRVVRGS